MENVKQVRVVGETLVIALMVQEQLVFKEVAVPEFVVLTVHAKPILQHVREHPEQIFNVHACICIIFNGKVL